MRVKLILIMAALLSGNLMAAVEPTSHEDPIIVNGNSVHINMRTRTMNLPANQVGGTKLFQHMHGDLHSGMRQVLVYAQGCNYMGRKFLCSETSIGPTDLISIEVTLQNAGGIQTFGEPIKIKQETIPGFVSPAHARAQHELNEKIHWLNVKRKIFFFSHGHFDRQLVKRRLEQKEFEHVWSVSTKSAVTESARSKEPLDPGDDSGEVRKFDYVPPSGSTAWPTGVSIIAGGIGDARKVEGIAKFGECYIVEVDHWVEKTVTLPGRLHSHVQMLIDKTPNGPFPYCSERTQTKNEEVSR